MKLNLDSRLANIAQPIDDDNFYAQLLAERKQALTYMVNLDKIGALDVAWKTKVNYVIKEDENTKNFHVLLKKTKALDVDSGCFSGQGMAYRFNYGKKGFYDFFSSKFQPFNRIKLSIRSNRFSSLGSKTSSSLEVMFLSQGMKDAVWDCGGDRSLGPNGFSFAFLKHCWDLLGEDIISFVQEFFYVTSCFENFLISGLWIINGSIKGLGIH